MPNSEDPDQMVWLYNLIWVLSGWKCHKVNFYLNGSSYSLYNSPTSLKSIFFYFKSVYCLFRVVDRRFKRVINIISVLSSPHQEWDRKEKTNGIDEIS